MGGGLCHSTGGYIVSFLIIVLWDEGWILGISRIQRLSVVLVERIVGLGCVYKT